MAEQTYVHHLIAQLHSTLDFLVSQHQISRPRRLPHQIKTPRPRLIHLRLHTRTHRRSYPTLSHRHLVFWRKLGVSPDVDQHLGILPISFARRPPPPQHLHQQQQQQQQPLPTPPAAPQAPAVVAAPVDTRKRAKALWSYAGGAPDDLSFEKGEVVIVTSEENADWWRGEVVGREGHTGLFPSNHVERLPDPTPSPSQDRDYGPPSNPSASSYSTAPAHSYGPPPGQGGWQNGANNGYGNTYGGDVKQGYGMPPPPSQQQPQQVQGEPQGQTVVVEQKKKGPLQGRLGQAFAGGVGFGAGSAVASNIVNAIL